MAYSKPEWGTISRSVSACLDSILLIFSDLDTTVDGHQVIDVLSDLCADFVHGNDQLESYVLQKELAQNGTLGSEAASQVKGWQTDKFKFLPRVSRAWRMRPEKRWYVFYEDDTYIVGTTCSVYSPTSTPTCPGTLAPHHQARVDYGWLTAGQATSFHVKRSEDLSKTTSTAMAPFDSVLGLALHEDAQTNLSGLFPMFQPHPLHGIPLSDTYWCQPVISMHKTFARDMVSLRRWEESRRIMQRPLLFADLVEYLNLTKVAIREDWTNSDFRGYRAPGQSAHASFDACGQACKADPGCLQWTYHLRDCTFVSTTRLGQSMEPGFEKWRSEEQKAAEWAHEEKRYMAGWDFEGIKRWVGAESRDCKTARWVTPSLKRIF